MCNYAQQRKKQLGIKKILSKPLRKRQMADTVHEIFEKLCNIHVMTASTQLDLPGKTFCFY
jgi:hypothetical protein